jgi:hypothetical protein
MKGGSVQDVVTSAAGYVVPKVTDLHNANNAMWHSFSKRVFFLLFQQLINHGIHLLQIKLCFRTAVSQILSFSLYIALSKK